jgi:hypothetical protein
VSRIAEMNLATGARRTLVRHRKASLTNPSILGGDLLYVRASPYSQSVMLNDTPVLKLGPAIRADKGYSTKHGPHRPSWRRPPRTPNTDPRGTTTTLWTTALAPDAVYVTRLHQRRGSGPAADLLRLAR